MEPAAEGNSERHRVFDWLTKVVRDCLIRNVTIKIIEVYGVIFGKSKKSVFYAGKFAGELVVYQDNVSCRPRNVGASYR